MGAPQLGVELRVAVQTGATDDRARVIAYHIKIHRTVTRVRTAPPPPVAHHRTDQRYVAVARVQPQRQVEELAQRGPAVDALDPRHDGWCTGGPALSRDSGVKVSMCAIGSPSARHTPLE
ncbi:hypothetical protein GCM10009682_29450 [Luedemannella flava]|uniref:Uncharacterized protein n=1 Tax=Luedemannella flava TaxID=349316 RepID=A0ABP4Y7Y0_9ACTN